MEENRNQRTSEGSATQKNTMQMGPGGPGRGPVGPGGPGGRFGRKVEKPKDAKKTLKRMLKYFSSEGKLLIPLLTSVFIIVCCSVYAPKLQSNAIDAITQGKFDTLNPILITMFVVYAISSLCSFCVAPPSGFGTPCGITIKRQGRELPPKCKSGYRYAWQ